MRIHRFRFAPIAAALLAAACGGDGGGGSATPAPQPPPGPALIQISAANQDGVAQAAVGSILPFTSVSSIGITPAAATATRPAPGMARALAVQTETMGCGLSGTITASWDDRDNNATPSAGDTMTMSFVQCRDAPDMSIDGTALLTLASATATDLAGALTAQQLVVMGEGSSLLMNGVLAFRITETAVAGGIRSLGTYTVGSAGLTVATSGSTYADTLTYREGYSVTQDDFVPNAVGAYGTSVITANGNFKSNTLGGDLALTTTQAFRLTDPDPGPIEGQLMIGGLNNTKLGLTAVSNLQARMDLCDDGDGVWEATKTVDWTLLIP